MTLEKIKYILVKVIEKKVEIMKKVCYNKLYKNLERRGLMGRKQDRNRVNSVWVPIQIRERAKIKKNEDKYKRRFRATVERFRV